MLVFGGIHEVTKELDDLHVFDFKNLRWIELFEEQISPLKRKSPNMSPNLPRGALGGSPGLRPKGMTSSSKQDSF